MTQPETEHGERWLCFVQTPPTMSLGWAGTDLPSSTSRTMERERRLHLTTSSKAMETFVQTVSHSSIILEDSWKNYIWGKLTIFHPLPPKTDNLKGMAPLNMQPTRTIPEFQGQSRLFFLFIIWRGLMQEENVPRESEAWRKPRVRQFPKMPGEWWTW